MFNSGYIELQSGTGTDIQLKKNGFVGFFSSFFFVGGCSALVSDTNLTCSLARLELVMWPRLSI